MEASMFQKIQKFSLWQSRGKFLKLCLPILLFGTHFSQSLSMLPADLVLYEGFDVSPGTLALKAGTSSFGFKPATVWDSGSFGAPIVDAGSIAAPKAVSSYYQASSVGNKVIEDFQSTVISREDDVDEPHLFGTYLAEMNLFGDVNTRSSVHFTNFSVFADSDGTGSTTSSWKVQTSGGIFDSGLNGQGTTLVSWEVQFNQSNSLSADVLRVWFNKNPLNQVADIVRTTDDLGQNLLGGISLNNSIFLGLSQARYDEFRIGTDWNSVGITSIPESSNLICLGLAILFAAIYIRNPTARAASPPSLSS
jgi:hypothetical protein